MKCSNPKSTLFLLSIMTLALAGCNSSGSNNKVAANPNKTSESKPKADYNFNETERTQLLAERTTAIQQSKLTYDSTVYSVSYSVDLDEAIVLLLRNSAGDKELTLSVPNEPDDKSVCVMGILNPAGNRNYVFDCTPSHVTENDEINTYSGAFKFKAPLSIPDSPDFTLELHEHIKSIGSTELVLNSSTNPATITTKNPFSAYEAYEDLEGTDLGVTTYTQLKKHLDDSIGHEREFVFNSVVNGSVDDDINMYTGLLIHDNALDTRITKTGSVFSGGTDLFSAGRKRILESKDLAVALEKNKQIGVHSWAESNDSGKSLEGKDIPYSNESHRKQATYFNRLLGTKGIDFYIFTLKSAPASGAHYMTKSELETYKLVTEYK